MFLRCSASMRLVVAVLFPLGATAAAQAQVRYSIQPVAVPGHEVAGVVINDVGDYAVTLGLRIRSPRNELRISSLNGLAPLITLGGRVHGVADLNNNGLAVGSSQDADGRQQAVVYTVSGTFLVPFNSNQSPPTFDLVQREAVAVNDAGQIVGNVHGSASTRAVLVETGGHVVELGTLGGDISVATDINNHGQVTGISLTGAPFGLGARAAPAQEGFLYANGAMKGIGTLGGDTSNAFAINDLGHVVGESTTDQATFHAFIYDEIRGMRDLAPVGSRSVATAINNAGIIAGHIQDDSGLPKAVLFSEAAPPIPLAELIPNINGWTRLLNVTDINAAGWIAGVGVFGGEMTGFILAPLPEPSTNPLAVQLLAAMCGMRRCRRRSGRNAATWRYERRNRRHAYERNDVSPEKRYAGSTYFSVT